MCGTVISMSTTTFPGNSYQQYFYYIKQAEFHDGPLLPKSAFDLQNPI